MPAMFDNDDRSLLDWHFLAVTVRIYCDTNNGCWNKLSQPEILSA